jgi:integrase
VPAHGAAAASPRDPDEAFNELFAALPSNRDRALVAFWISTGVRAAELLGVRQRDLDPGQQLITVARKGSRAVQQVPASADAFVWLRLYQEELHGKVPRGWTQPVWWTLRRPYRPLTYITPPTACSSGLTPPSAASGRCMTCGTAPRRGWCATPS